MRQPRVHRLPQRLDYTLVPAPLDVSLPLVDDKAELPAIIVTPSSPISPTDFSIAFLAPPPKKSIFSKLPSLASIPIPVAFNPRVVLLLLLLTFILACHLVTHQLAVLQPHLDFDIHTQQEYAVATDGAVGAGGSWKAGAHWFGLDKVLGSALENRTNRSFVVVDPGH